MVSPLIKKHNNILFNSRFPTVRGLFATCLFDVVITQTIIFDRRSYLNNQTKGLNSKLVILMFYEINFSLSFRSPTLIYYTNLLTMVFCYHSMLLYVTLWIFIDSSCVRGLQIRREECLYLSGGRLRTGSVTKTRSYYIPKHTLTPYINTNSIIYYMLL